jgi:RNA polymerase sigma-70 factor (ECF subfamily)
MSGIGEAGCFFAGISACWRLVCNKTGTSLDYIDGRATVFLGDAMTDWSQIVAQHGPLVWRTAQRLLRHEADAADCFQRTFMAALEVSRKEEVRHWPALLKRLATARALEQLRQRVGLRKRLVGDPEENGIERQIDGKTPGPDGAAQANELAGDLRTALAEIDARQAEVFCLACIEECSYAKVAEQLEITVSNVGVLLNRAKAALREQLQSHQESAIAVKVE